MKMKDQMSMVEVVKIDDPEDAVRSSIDPEKIRELAESIREQGLIQPIVVRPKDGRYEVIAGHRRLLAHRFLHEEKIKAIIKDATEEEVFFIRAIENLQREDLNPIEKGKLFLGIKNRYGLTEAALAKKVGFTAPTVKEYLDVLEVPAEYHQGIIDRKVSSRTMNILNQIQDPEFKRYYMTSAVENGITRELALKWVDDYKKSQQGIYYNEDGSVQAMAALEEEKPIYQTCYCCHGPINIKEIKYIPVCRECDKTLRRGE